MKKNKINSNFLKVKFLLFLLLFLACTNVKDNNEVKQKRLKVLMILR